MVKEERETESWKVTQTLSATETRYNIVYILYQYNKEQVMCVHMYVSPTTI